MMVPEKGSSSVENNREFICGVKDKNDLLYKLSLLGYYDDFQNIENAKDIH
jgi:hypothetical protein